MHIRAKSQKFVNLVFVDDTTLEQRHELCQQEPLLNRCFSTNVDLAVVRWRLSPDATIEAFLAPETHTEDHMAELASTLAAFHDLRPIAEPLASYGTLARRQAHWPESIIQAPDSVGHTLSQPMVTPMQQAIMALFARQERKTRYDHHETHSSHG